MSLINKINSKYDAYINKRTLISPLKTLSSLQSNIKEQWIFYAKRAFVDTEEIFHANEKKRPLPLIKEGKIRGIFEPRIVIDNSNPLYMVNENEKTVNAKYSTEYSVPLIAIALFDDYQDNDAPQERKYIKLNAFSSIKGIYIDNWMRARYPNDYSIYKSDFVYILLLYDKIIDIFNTYLDKVIDIVNPNDYKRIQLLDSL